MIQASDLLADGASAGKLALRRGMTAARAGFNSVASAHLERAVDLLPDDPQVWLWLAWVANSPDNALRCLQHVLEVAPGHPAATAGLKWIQSLAHDELQSPVAVSELPREAEISINSELLELPNDTEVSAVEVSAAEPVLQIVDISSVMHEIVQAPAPEKYSSVISGLPEAKSDEELHEALARMEAAPEKAAIESREPEKPVDVAVVGTPLRESWNAEATEADTAQWSWNDLVRRANEMPLPPRDQPAAAPLSEERRSNTSVPVSLPTVSLDVTTAAEVASVPVAEVPVVSRTEDVTAPATEEIHEPETTMDVERLAQSFQPTSAVSSTDSRPLVMIVDDSPTVRKLVSLTLERRGYRVISAFDGVAAIKELGAYRPDLILLDINMPRLDGYRLCKLIKKHEATQNIPIVMLSGKDGMFDKLRGRLVGCSDYITKPFEADTLTLKVAKYLVPSTTTSL